MLKKSLSLLILCALLSWPARSADTASAGGGDVQQQAIAAFRAGQFLKAAEMYKSLMVSKPNDVDLMKDLMWSYWNAGKSAETIQTAKHVLEIKPGDREAQSLLGKAYQASGDRQGAVQTFEKVVAATPGSLSARLSYINSLIQAGQTSRAEGLIQELEPEAENNPALSQKLTILWKQLAKRYAEYGGQSKAIDTYKHALGGSGTNEQIQVAMARLQADQRNYGQAEDTLKVLLEATPDAKNVYPKLANIQFLKGDYNGAAESWAIASRYFPEKTEYKFKRAQSLYYDTQYKQALREMEDLVQDPQWGRKALDFLFDDAFSRDDYEAAAKVMEENLPYFEYKPEDMRRLIRLSDVYERMGKFDKAIEAVDIALDRYPNSGEALTIKAALYNEVGKGGAAAEILESIVKENPNATNSLYALVDAYETSGGVGGKLSAVRRYRELDPTNPYILLREAQVLFSVDRRKAAKKLLTKWIADNGQSQVLPILLYHGVTANKRDGLLAHSQHHSVSMLDSHFSALKRAGYEAVSIAQVDAWITNGKPLPERPVLITFDDGRLDGMRNADPLLAKYGMKATMFVICQNSERNLPNYASWSELRKFGKTGRWEYQAHTDKGHSYVAVDNEGYKGLYLINRQWLPAVNRLEVRQEWVDRVNSDHVNAKRKLKNELGVEATAFAFPEGNYGQVEVPNVKYSADVNLAAARSNYKMAFFQDQNGLNTRSRDPHLMNRVEPPHAWNGNDLLRHISDKNPANRMRIELYRWAVWQGHINEAKEWLAELKLNGASQELLAKEEARLHASRGRTSSASQLNNRADRALGVSKYLKHETDPLLEARRPAYFADSSYFVDGSERKNWFLHHGLSTGWLGSMKFRGMQRLGKYQEHDSIEVTESAVGLGASAALGLRQSIDIDGMQHWFGEDAKNQTSMSGALNSQWSDYFRTQLRGAREPLFYGEALTADIHLKLANIAMVYENGNTWDASVEGEAARFSDENDREMGRFTASRAIGSAGTPRIIYRVYGVSNRFESPFYYSPESLLENNLGLSHAFRVRGPYLLTLSYLPGIGKETKKDSRFVQNAKADLFCRWGNHTDLKLGYTYNQNPSYHSNEVKLSFDHRFGSGLPPAKFLPKGRVTTSESPQSDMSESGPF